MPVFINEVVVRGQVGRDREDAVPARGPDGTTAAAVPDRDALVAEVTAAVLDRLDRRLERLMTER